MRDFLFCQLLDNLPILKEELIKWFAVFMMSGTLPICHETYAAANGIPEILLRCSGNPLKICPLELAMRDFLFCQLLYA